MKNSSYIIMAETLGTIANQQDKLMVPGYDNELLNLIDNSTLKAIELLEAWNRGWQKANSFKY